ncbi:MAG: hypothetical protein R3D89_04095 [Sphingomonadaceae bacterium]
MRRFLAAAVTIALASCGVGHQPESAKAVAAFEIPVPTQADRAKLISIMSAVAESEGYHVDASTDEELRASYDIAPMTIHAGVWRGEDDDESIATVLDLPRPGYAWLTFSKGENPVKSRRFETRLMNAIRKEWEEVMELPIVDGGIPHPEDMVT